RTATDPHRVRDLAVPEPRGAQRARPQRVGETAALHHDRDVVAGAAAAEASDVLDGPGGGAHANLCERASRERYSERARATSAARHAAGVRPRANTLQMGWPRPMGSPGSGTPRTSSTSSHPPVPSGAT